MRKHTFLLLTLFAAAVPCAWLSAEPPKPAPADQKKPAAADEFARDVLPFLEKHCVACHNPEKRKGELILSAYRDEASVVKNRVVWQAVTKMVQTGEMPPKSRPRPAAADTERFDKAVATILDRADRSGKRDPGHVTVRRLNRVEYNNTIRDLTGIDFQPAEDFPSDDVGYGFDNIGDVLSLSPILMERYLTAAESVVQRAVLLEAPKPPQHPTAAQFLSPRTRGEPGVRTLAGRDSLFYVYRVTDPGEYTFRVRAYGQPADHEAPKVGLYLDGKELATHEVKATDEKRAGSYEAHLTLKAGEYKTEARFLNPSAASAPREPPVPAFIPVAGTLNRVAKSQDKNKPRTLFVRRFELEGPKDSYPPSHKKIMACDPKGSHTEKTREILTRFASHAYRRPATKDEVDRLVKLAESAEERGEKWEAGIQLALEAVLVSPKFLFRVELDDRPDSREPHPIDEYQLASRLSYFLWSTTPDDELTALAAKKQLTANLDAQVKRMLKDPRSSALVENFALQWLQLKRLKDFTPDPKRFPTFDDRLRESMFKETELFFDAIMREDRSVLDLIDGDFTFLNRRLADHYGIADTNGNLKGQKPTKPEGNFFLGERFVRVSLQGGQRGGLLTQASVLAVTSNPTRTSPVKRGKWVLEQLLGTPPPPPPPNVPQLEDAKRQLTGTLRQRMTQHRVDPACANCHAKMDPIGFAFENYDAIGAFRTKDEGLPIDPSGTLPDGKSFKGPAELKQILKGKKELFCRCLTEKMLTYALGRGVEYYDRPTVEHVNAALAKNDYRFSVLVTEIVKSDPFRLRRGKE
jgi:mono/diheme cytochrome c family protein